MSRGASDIPDLRLEVIQKFVETFGSPPELVLSNMFIATNSPSSTIKWESRKGGRGMTPFVAPGAPAPVTNISGIAKHSAEAAYWKEKIPFDEEFLNNLRKEGTESEYLDARTRLAKELVGLINRASRRKEWMFAKMLFSGSFSYSATSGIKLSVDYDIDSNHVVTLGTDYKWESGTKRDMIGNIIDGKKKISDDCGGKANYALCNSTVLKYLARDPDLLTLLQKSAFGESNLFSGSRNSIVGVNPKVLGSLLDIDNLVVYDEQYEVRSWLTAAVTADSTTTIYVDDITDFEASQTLRFWDTSAGTYEDETISSISVENGTITVSSAPSTSYKAGEDYVVMTKKFIDDDKFCMFASRVDGQSIAEYKRAPFGLARNYGLVPDQKQEWDPEVLWIRVQDKGLPVLYQRDAVYILDVN